MGFAAPTDSAGRFPGSLVLSTRLSLQPGSECIIRSLGPDKKIAQQFAQMGMLPGTHLRIIRITPFGGTLEVSMDEGQHFALRDEELDALDCKMVAMPISANTVKKKQNYRIRSLSGGRTFHQKMAYQGVLPGTIIQIQDLATRPFLIKLLPEGKTVALGEGEAEKIIIEVMSARHE